MDSMMKRAGVLAAGDVVKIDQFKRSNYTELSNI